MRVDSRKKGTPTHVCEREGPLCTCEKWGTVRRKEEKKPPTIPLLVGPFRFLGDIIRRWLWAHSRISTSLFWWAHSGLLTLIFGDGYGPTQEYRHLPFSGPIQVYWRHYSAMAVGPFKNIDIFVLVGPLRIIDINIWQWLWAHISDFTEIL